MKNHISNPKNMVFITEGGEISKDLKIRRKLRKNSGIN